jgi:hypothetical protein
LDRRLGAGGGDSLGVTWSHLDSLGLTWIHLDLLGPTWTHLDSLGLTWTHLDSLGLTWTHLDSPGLTWSHLDSLGLTWTHLDSLGLTWIHLGSLGLTGSHLDSFWSHGYPTREKGKPSATHPQVNLRLASTRQPGRVHARTHARHGTTRNDFPVVLSPSLRYIYIYIYYIYCISIEREGDREIWQILKPTSYGYEPSHNFRDS